MAGCVLEGGPPPLSDVMVLSFSGNSRGEERRGAGKIKGRKEERKTYSRAAEPATASLSRYAERVAAAGGSNRHAKGSQVGGGGHAALDCVFPS